MPNFRKRPVIISAVQIDCVTQVHTMEGVMTGKPGDWLITGVKGEQYICDDEIFRMTYEPTDDVVESATPTKMLLG